MIKSLFQYSFILILSISTFGLPSLDAAQVYTWKDAAGVVHYSDKPFPQARSTEKLDIKAARPKTMLGSNNQANNQANSEANAPQNMAAEERARMTKECSQARKNLVTLAKPGEIKRRGLDGEVITLNQNEIRAEVQRNQNFLSQQCQTARTRVSPRSNRYSGEENEEESDEEFDEESDE